MMTTRVLIVCTGNICRSPLAAVLLRARLGTASDIEVTSAGTTATVGDPMSPQAEAIALRLGASDATAHRARQLEPWVILDADLILAMTREHRREILDLAPSATLRTFTLREFAHISAALPDRVPDIATIAALRGVVPPLRPAQDADVIDPYGQADAVYEAAAAQLIPAVNETARFLHRTVGAGA